MNDGTVALVKGDQHARFPYGLANRVIAEVTGSPYTHVKLYFDGATHEVTTPGGYRKTEGEPSGDLFLEPVYAWNDEKKARSRQMLEGMKHDRYNYLRLVMLIIVYPTRKFWRALRWFPGCNRYIWGDVCSSFVDVWFRHGPGWDLWPDDPESYTAPGDFTKTWGLREVSK